MPPYRYLKSWTNSIVQTTHMIEHVLYFWYFEIVSLLAQLTYLKLQIIILDTDTGPSSQTLLFNALLNYKISVVSKLKGVADDYHNVTQKLKFVFEGVIQCWEKGANAT